MSFLDVQNRLRRNSSRYGIEGVLRGTAIMGTVGTGKTFLLQSRAVEALRLAPESFLSYVGTTGRHEPFTEALAGPFANANRNHYPDRLTFEGDNIFAGIYGPTWAGDGKSAVHMTMLHALTQRGKYILALDDPMFFFPAAGERAELFAMIKKLVDAPAPHLTLLMTFGGVKQIADCFGEEGAGLFARLHEKFILQNHVSENGLLRGAGANVGGAVADVSMLLKGEAVHILDGRPQVVTFGLDKTGGPTGKKGLRRVGFWRRRKLASTVRGGSLLCQARRST